MSTVRQRIGENDFVALCERVESWPTGRSGTVVAERGSSKLVEISDDQGVALDFVTVPETQLDLISKHSD
jgi:hypothetical protein